MPSSALRTGASIERVETAFSGVPLKPTRVPLRVWRTWDAEMEADRREDDAPSTSKRASVEHVRHIEVCREVDGRLLTCARCRAAIARI